MRLIVTLISVLGLTLGTAHAGGYGHGYSYYYPSYQTYYQPTYYAPSYSYYTPTYSYYDAGFYQGRWYPAGNYAQINGQWYMQGGYVQGYAAPAAAYTPPAYKDGWKTAVLETAKARDDQATYLKAINALGFSAPIQAPPGGTYAAYGGYALPPVASGNTLYGHTFETIRSSYGDVNMASLYQQSARLTQGAQQLAGQANTEFSGLVTQAGENQARVATILAEGQARSALIRSSALAPQSSTQTTVTQIRAGAAAGQQGGSALPPAPPGPDPAPVPQAQAGAAFLQLSGPATCVGCHSGQNAAGGFRIADYPGMDLDQKTKVIARIGHHDLKKRMPLGKDNGPGVPLTPEQWKHFLSN